MGLCSELSHLPLTEGVCVPLALNLIHLPGPQISVSNSHQSFCSEGVAALLSDSVLPGLWGDGPWRLCFPGALRPGRGQ